MIRSDLIRFALPLLACATFLSGCATAPAPSPSHQPATKPVPPRAIGARDIRRFRQVARQVEPVAEHVCRNKNPKAPKKFCDFNIILVKDGKRSPNAFQTIGKDGRPVLAFNHAMLGVVANDHETAFILSHEAAHQIRHHLNRRRTQAGIGGILLGVAAAALGASSDVAQSMQKIGSSVGARVYSIDHEFEADALGAYIAAIAGYDPALGARSFQRVPDGSDSFLSSHPSNARRIAQVETIAARIRAQQAAGGPIQVP